MFVYLSLNLERQYLIQSFNSCFFYCFKRIVEFLFLVVSLAFLSFVLPSSVVQFSRTVFASALRGDLIIISHLVPPCQGVFQSFFNFFLSLSLPRYLRDCRLSRQLTYYITSFLPLSRCFCDFFEFFCFFCVLYHIYIQKSHFCAHRVRRTHNDNDIYTNYNYIYNTHFRHTYNGETSGRSA